MKRFLCTLLITLSFSCNNERIVQLPEIENAKITEVLDVSPAYIFYDETQPDSTLFNRKNLIGTTNWLVNVDKRLTLSQAIPHIQILQDKRKKASMHKNESAKNYFTCNDTNIGNLGFVEFTNSSYEQINLKKSQIKNHAIKLNLFDNVSISENPTFQPYVIIEKENLNNFKNQILAIIKDYNTILENKKTYNITGYSLNLYFDKQLQFQDYISCISELTKLDKDKMIINTNEFIY
jgi:hypothetical protein